MASVAPSSWEEILAAALAAGPEAVVSHESAAAVHRFEYADVTAIELTLPRNVHSKPPGALVHRCTDLATCDFASRRGVLVTSSAGRWSTWLGGGARSLPKRPWTKVWYSVAGRWRRCKSAWRGPAPISPAGRTSSSY